MNLSHTSYKTTISICTIVYGTACDFKQCPLTTGLQGIVNIKHTVSNSRHLGMESDLD